MPPSITMTSWHPAIVILDTLYSLWKKLLLVSVPNLWCIVSRMCNHHSRQKTWTSTSCLLGHAWIERIQYSFIAYICPPTKRYTNLEFTKLIFKIESGQYHIKLPAITIKAYVELFERDDYYMVSVVSFSLKFSYVYPNYLFGHLSASRRHIICFQQCEV